MRSTQTFILRLLVDTDDPKRLRGAIRSIIQGEDRPFADDAALLSLLRSLMDESERPSAFTPTGMSPDGEIDGLQEM